MRDRIVSGAVCKLKFKFTRPSGRILHSDKFRFSLFVKRRSFLLILHAIEEILERDKINAEIRN